MLQRSAGSAHGGHNPSQTGPQKRNPIPYIISSKLIVVITTTEFGLHSSNLIVVMLCPPK